MVFVQAFNAFALPRPSEYDLYHSFVVWMYDTDGGADRELAWADFGACCRDGPGLSLATPSRRLDVGVSGGGEDSFDDFGTGVGVGGGGLRGSCDEEEMHAGLAQQVCCQPNVKI